MKFPEIPKTRPGIVYKQILYDGCELHVPFGFLISNYAIDTKAREIYAWAKAQAIERGKIK